MYLYISMDVRIHSMYVCVEVYGIYERCVCMYVSAYMYVSMYACKYLPTCLYIYVRMYV